MNTHIPKTYQTFEQAVADQDRRLNTHPDIHPEVGRIIAEAKRKYRLDVMAGLNGFDEIITTAVNAAYELAKP